MVHGDIKGKLTTESEKKQVKNKLVQFSDSATNTVIYFSYLMDTSDNYVKE